MNIGFTRKEITNKTVYNDSIVFEMEIEKLDTCKKEEGIWRGSKTEVIRFQDIKTHPTFGTDKSAKNQSIQNFEINTGIGLSSFGVFRSLVKGTYQLQENVVSEAWDYYEQYDLVEGVGRVEEKSGGPTFSKLDSVICYAGNTLSFGNCDYLLDVITSTKKRNTLVDVSITPNPANDFINVSAPERVNYQVINTTGIVVKEGILEKRSKLNVSSLETGLYLVRLKGKNKVYQNRFIKK